MENDVTKLKETTWCEEVAEWNYWL